MTNGAPLLIPQSPAAAATIHTFDAPATGDQNGRPGVDVVSLWINNVNGSEDAVVTVLFMDGVTQLSAVEVTVDPGTIVQVFNETPFSGLANGAPSGMTMQVLLKSGEQDSDTAFAFGWFVRTTG